MKIEKKDNYTLFISEETSFVDFTTAFTAVVQNEESHLIVVLNDTLQCTVQELSFFYPIAEEFAANSRSFILVNNQVDIDDFPEEFNVAPTLLEAEDILEMEDIQRDLGF